MTWSARNVQLSAGVVQFALDRESVPTSFAQVIHGWQHDGEFRSFFFELLAGSPFTAFRWETPPLTAANADTLFEFVLIDDPSLARKPDQHTFADQFRGATASVVTFPNLGGDAVLVVPCPLASPETYGHLAAFVRHAPTEQQHALWQAVGAALAQRLSDAPVWLSTAGAGVPWLHVRLDGRPKYYHHRPYREWGM